MKDRPIRIASLGHVAFALTMIALGILGLIKGDFAAVWQPVPKGMAGRDVLVYLCAFICLLSGIGLLWQRAAALAARVLLVYLLLWLLLLRVPGMFLSFSVDFWWAACKIAVMAAGGWVLYAWFAGEWDKERLGFATGERGVQIARMLYGLALIPFGLAHFIYLNATAPLVPDWLPAHVAWAYFTGSTFIAAGVAVITGIFARLAAALSAWQIGMFTVLIWVPIVAAGANRFQWSEFVVSVALTAGAWVVADSYRNMPWFAVNKR